MHYVHWNEAEAESNAAILRETGHDVTVHWAEGGDGLRGLVDDPPDCFVIDLRRLPSHGRSVATFVRQRKGLRHIPVVYVEGDAVKTARALNEVPATTAAPWKEIAEEVARALKTPVTFDRAPGTMDSFVSRPLVAKLGVREDDAVVLVDAPDGMEGTIGDLPSGASFRHGARGSSRVVLLFCRSRAELEERFATAGRVVAGGGRLWVCWTKTTSDLHVDLGAQDVREFGLAAQWVDFKICRIDDDWAGLCFSRRKERRRANPSLCPAPSAGST